MQLGKKHTFDQAEAEQREGKSTGITIRMDLDLLKDVTTMARVRGHTFISDETGRMGGDNKAPRPLEYLLAGLGFSFMSVLSRTAADMDLDVQSASLTLEGTSRFYVGFEKIKIKVNISSHEPEEKLKELLRVTEERSPGTQTLKRPVNVTVELSKDKADSD